MERSNKQKINTRELGAYYEEVAVRYLEERGYRVVQRNYRCPLGEIDIIAWHEGYLVFVEVKYRKNDGHGDGWAAVNYVKQRKISRVAGWFMTRQRIMDNVGCRFDVVGIEPEGIRLCQNAFDYVG
jgi:putative endonuclease